MIRLGSDKKLLNSSQNSMYKTKHLTKQSLVNCARQNADDTQCSVKHPHCPDPPKAALNLNGCQLEGQRWHWQADNRPGVGWRILLLVELALLLVECIVLLLGVGWCILLPRVVHTITTNTCLSRRISATDLM